MKSPIKYVILVLCLLWQVQSKSQTGHFYSSGRLSSSLITCICQDRYGFIWVGTEYGLNKFDGYRFTTYFHSRNDSTTINDNEISTLFVDRDGRLWVGCSRGLVSYDYEHDNFRRALTEMHGGKIRAQNRKDGTVTTGAMLTVSLPLGKDHLKTEEIEDTPAQHDAPSPHATKKQMMTHEVGISRAQLHRKMKEMTGISTSEFVRNLRLEQAARLIREKKINITQVAYSVGFNNQAHFSTVFKKHFGMTPTEYAGGS